MVMAGLAVVNSGELFRQSWGFIAPPPGKLIQCWRQLLVSFTHLIERELDACQLVYRFHIPEDLQSSKGNRLAWPADLLEFEGNGREWLV